MFEFADIIAALKVRYRGYSDSAYRTAAIRVHHNLETEGPVTEVDRLFLGGPDEDRSDIDVLIDRTLLAIDKRNAEARGPT